jgi:hypothetical protein
VECWLLSGLSARMAQALQLNLEHDLDILCRQPQAARLSVPERESRRRLMWACYQIDTLSGSGVKQLSILFEDDIRIQLPCNDRNFGLGLPSVTETLKPGEVLKFIPPEDVPSSPAENMGLMAYMVRVLVLRQRVLTYVPWRMYLTVDLANIWKLLNVHGYQSQSSQQ